MLKVKQIFFVMAAVVSIGRAALTVAQVKPERVSGAPTTVGITGARRNHATKGRHHHHRRKSSHRRHKRVPNAKSLKNESY